jgi:hypothetical protein
MSYLPHRAYYCHILVIIFDFLNFLKNVGETLWAVDSIPKVFFSNFLGVMLQNYMCGDLLPS